MEPLVTVVMAAHNAERYVAAAVNSVLAQTHTNWELIVVNDGSSDGTASVLADFHDPRIRVIHQANGGIGHARNTALDQAKGEFLCCLDSDDVFPSGSIEARLNVFRAEPTVDIVDGKVAFMNENMTSRLREYTPTFKGEPFHELLTFSGRCFMGPSWMIRWHPDETLRYEEGISHAEDLHFCLMYCRGRSLSYTEETVLLYRRSGTSSMTKNFEGMERSLRWIGNMLRSEHLVSKADLRTFAAKRKRIMAGTYWKERRYWRSIRAWFR